MFADIYNQRTIRPSTIVASFCLESLSHNVSLCLKMSQNVSKCLTVPH